MNSTKICPICKAEKAENPRYPNYVCRNCAFEAADELGDGLVITNAGTGDGIAITSKVTGQERNSRDCFVRGVHCFVRQAHLGGVVIQVYSEN